MTILSCSFWHFKSTSPLSFFSIMFFKLTTLSYKLHYTNWKLFSIPFFLIPWAFLYSYQFQVNVFQSVFSSNPYISRILSMTVVRIPFKLVWNLNYWLLLKVLYSQNSGHQGISWKTKPFSSVTVMNRSRDQVKSILVIVKIRSH